MFGQTSPAQLPPSRTDIDPAILAFRQDQQALLQKESALIAQGATSEQLANWLQQNASQFSASNQRFEALSESQAPFLPLQRIPENASAAVKEFMQNQSVLADSLAQLQDRSSNVSSASTSGAQTNDGSQDSTQASDPVVAQWKEENASLLQRQEQLKQVIATEQAQEIAPTPPPSRIAPDASPLLRAYLALRDQLTLEKTQIANAYRSSDPATQAQVQIQWQQQNATRLVQLNQMALAVSQERQN